MLRKNANTMHEICVMIALTVDEFRGENHGTIPA
jgi:hypothetical protein